jgi:hypothetical protein
MGGIAEYERLDAMGLAALIARRCVTASEVLDEAIERAKNSTRRSTRSRCRRTSAPASRPKRDSPKVRSPACRSR